MSTAVARAVAGMAQSLERLAGCEGVYARGTTESEPILGVPVQHEYEVNDDETNLPIKVVFYDWIFTAADLVLGGNSITPRSGDRWTSTIEGELETYEVLPIDKRPCFERQDTSGILLVVHTKKIS